MLPLFKKLTYKKNWWSAIFSPLSREVVDGETGETVLFFKMRWDSSLSIYDVSRTKLLVEAKWMRSSGWRSWEVFVAGEKQGTLRMEVMQSFLALGSERWTILDAEGKEVLKVSTPGDSALKHVLDELTNLYNPTHALLVEDMKGRSVASMTMKHGFLDSRYDLVFEKVGEQERALVLALFSAILLMLRK